MGLFKAKRSCLQYWMFGLTLRGRNLNHRFITPTWRRLLSPSMHFGEPGSPSFSFPLSLSIPQGVPPGLLRVLTPALHCLSSMPPLLTLLRKDWGGGLWASGPWARLPDQCSPPRPVLNTPGGSLCVHKTLRAGFQASFQSKLWELGVGKVGF